LIAGYFVLDPWLLSLVALISGVLGGWWFFASGLPWQSLNLAVLPLLFLHRRFILFLLFFEAGLLLTSCRLNLPADHVAKSVPEYVCCLTGRVTGQIKEGVFSRKILLKTENWSGQDGREQNCRGLILVEMETGASVNPGQKVRFHQVRLERIDKAKNPGQEKLAGLWQLRGILLRGKARSFGIVDPGQGFYFRMRQFLRDRVEKIFAHYLKGYPEESLFLQTISVGGDTIPYFLRVLGLRSGTFHLLVISGLHVGFLFLLYSFVSFPLRRHFFRYHKAFSLSGLLILFFYAGLTGWHMATVRAVLMISFFLLGELLGREISGLKSIMMAALVLLLISPLALFEVGFQLSFVATSGILLTVTALEEYPFTRRLPWRPLWSATSGASVFVFPLLLYHFGYLSPLGLINNIIAVPLAALITMSSFLFWILPGLFSLPVRLLSSFFLKLLTILARFSPQYAATLNPATTFFLYAVLLCLVIRCPGRKRVIGLGFCLIGLFVSLVRINRPESNSTAIFFSAPELVCAFSSHNGLVIFTPDHDAPGNLRKFVLPFARKEKIRKVEALFFTEVTHDHWGAWQRIYRQLPVSTLYDLETAKNSLSWSKKPDYKVSHQFLRTKQPVFAGSGTVELLHHGCLEKNAPVYLLVQGNCRFLLASEVTKENSQALSGVRVDVAVIGKIGGQKQVVENVKGLRCLYLITPRRLKSQAWCEKLPRIQTFYLSDAAVAVRTDQRPFSIFPWDSL